MKYYSNVCFIVEGSNDVSYLSSLIEAEYIITNGYEIPSEEIDYIVELSKHKKIVILTDSDEAGFHIRERLNKLIEADNVVFDPNKTKKGKKHGVAETYKDEVINKLSVYLCEKINKKPTFSNFDYFSLKLNENKLKSIVCEKFHLGNCGTGW